jgi:hypothetical protein
MDNDTQGSTNQHRYNIHDSRSLDSRAHARRSDIKVLWIFSSSLINTCDRPDNVKSASAAIPSAAECIVRTTRRDSRFFPDYIYTLIDIVTLALYAWLSMDIWSGIDEDVITSGSADEPDPVCVIGVGECTCARRLLGCQSNYHRANAARTGFVPPNDSGNNG